jgi:protein Mpv17
MISYALLLASYPLQVVCFGVPEFVSSIGHIHHVAPSLLFPSTTILTSSTGTGDALDASSLPSSLYIAYKQALVTDPLPTKMTTGALLAIVGDGVAQRCVGDECPIYDSKRAVSFAVFDASYRAVQHVLYPPMISFFHGQYLSLLLSTVMSRLTAGNMAKTFVLSNHAPILAAMEQSLVSQLVIIPLLYYPVFYAVTGAVQGLTVDETIQRAQETFVPLMKRNLLFWIPIQFAVFGFCEEPLQIPILIVCGLVWTFILSLVAGSVQTQKTEIPEHVVVATNGEAIIVEEVYDAYCVTGMEPHCLIDPDDLFHAPHHPEIVQQEDAGDEVVVQKDEIVEKSTMTK